MKESKKENECRRNTDPRRKSVRRRKRRQWIVAGVVIVTILITAAALIARGCRERTDDLKGIWNYDDVTVYQFDGHGNGSLNLPRNSYPFKYKISKDEISIDFKSESARDVIYSFNVKNDILILTENEKGVSRTYELKKEK